MLPIAAENKGTSFKTTFMLVFAMLLVSGIISLFSGCGNQEAGNSASDEKLVYLVNDGVDSRIMLTGLDEGEGRTLLEWPEISYRFAVSHDGENYTVRRPEASGGDDSRRFSFSNDGRYFAVTPKSTAGTSHPLVISTEGSQVRQLPAGALWITFSPDSSKVAYWRAPSSTDLVFSAAVMDLASGNERILDNSGAPQGLSWIDDDTLVFNDTIAGIVYAIDLAGGGMRALTPDGTDTPYTYFAPPVSFVRNKLAIIKKKWHNNIWSLNPDTGWLSMVTNNSREKWNASYLPGTSDIIFQEGPQEVDHQIFSDLFLLTDDGSQLSMLVDDNFYFNGLYTVSLASDRIAYQHAEEEETSVWVTDSSGGAGNLVAASRDSWLGDPNFAPVPEWGEKNPLAMEVETGAIEGGDIKVRVTNQSEASQNAVLRLFPGKDLQLEPAEAAAGAGANGIEIRLDLQPGESREMLFYAGPKSLSNSESDLTFLATLAVKGAPPVMAWRDLFNQY